MAGAMRRTVDRARALPLALAVCLGVGCPSAEETPCVECADGLPCEPDGYPGTTEICDGLDNDCDGVADEDFDADGDGYYDGGDFLCRATWGEGLVDCDDEDASAFPGAPEQCDWQDHDCDGEPVAAGDCTDECTLSRDDWSGCEGGCPTLAETLVQCPPEQAACRWSTCNGQVQVAWGELGGALLVFGGDCELIAVMEYSDAPFACFGQYFLQWYGPEQDLCDPPGLDELPPCAR